MHIPEKSLYYTKSEAEFRVHMIDLIRTTYQDILGPDINLLDQPNGLELVQAKVKSLLANSVNGMTN